MTEILTHKVAFGDCDPAGIVYYPNMFKWMDNAFHELLLPYGGHAKVCEELSSLGIGLASVTADFLRPLRDMDDVGIHIESISWTEKSVTLEYSGKIGDKIHFKGKEVRCMFMRSEKGVSAGPISPLRQLMES